MKDLDALRATLESVEAGSPTSPTAKQRACMPGLVEHGLANILPTGAYAMTSDGRDVLDALREPRLRESIEHALAGDGTPSLETIKAAVAERISGGFNA